MKRLPNLDQVDVALLYVLPWRGARVREDRKDGIFCPLQGVLAFEFKSLGSVGLGSERIFRFDLSDRTAGLEIHLERDGVPVPLAVSVICSVYENFKTASLLIAIRGAGLLSDEVIAIKHSGDGRALEDTVVRTGAKGSLRIAWGGQDQITLQSAAFRIIQAFSDEVLEQKALHALRDVSETCENLPLHKKRVALKSAAEERLTVDEWRVHPFARPRLCFELKAAGLTPQNAGRFSQALYGLLAGDEGWPFVAAEHAAARLESKWSTRSFFAVYAFGRAVLMINNKPADYVAYQREWWPRYFGYESAYFGIDYSIAGLDHGPFRMLENCLLSICLQESARLRIFEYLALLEGRRSRVTSAGGPDRSAAYEDQPFKLFHFLNPRNWGFDFDNMIWLTKSRARIFRLRIRIVDDVRKLTELRVQELKGLGDLLRREQGIDAGTESIRQRLAEVDAEFNILSSTSINSLLFVLAILGFVFALLSMLFQFSDHRDGFGRFFALLEDPSLPELVRTTTTVAVATILLLLVVMAGWATLKAMIVGAYQRFRSALWPFLD